MTKAAWIAVVLLFGFGALAHADSGPKAAPTVHIQVSALPPVGAPSFDPHKAVNAYLAQVSGKERTASNAYTEGGEDLAIVDVVYTVVVCALLLWLKISARMRNLAARMTRWRILQAPIYVAQFVVVLTLATLPLSTYEGYVREHAFGLSNQTFAQWAGDFGIAFLVQLAGLVVLLTVVYAVMRRVGRAWWQWGAAICVAFMVVAAMIAPVFIAPLFNHYTPLPQSAMKAGILSLARANGIPANDVYVYDASRQTKIISANVSGLFGTTRISLNDNLLNDCTPQEVMAVVGHEMGHYVMNHVAIGITWYGLLLFVGFWIADRAFRALAGLFGGNWDARDVDDPAGLPLFVAIFAVLGLLAMPITNTISRSMEAQADIFGLNAVRQPDALATAILKLADYRKLDPSPWEEFVFYDHPSGRDRIREAMRWKAEHIDDPDIIDGPKSPQ